MISMRLIQLILVALLVRGDASAGVEGLQSEHLPLLFGNSPEVVLGKRDEGLIFGRVSDIAVGPGGDIYVVDSGFAVVHHFRSPDEYVGAFGTTGEGPGEFTMPLSIAVDPNDGNVWIGNMHGRICEYTANGEVIDDIRFSWHGVRLVRSVAVAPGGELYVVSPNVLDNTMVHAFSQEGTLLRSFATTYAHEDPESDPYDEMTYAQGFLDVRGDRVFYVQKNPLEVRLYDLEGASLQTIRDPGFGVPYPPKVLQPDGRRIKHSLEGAWGIVALPRSGFLLNIVIPRSDELPVGSSIVVEFDDSGSVVRQEEFQTPLFVAESAPDGAIWAYDNQPFSRVFRFPGSESSAP